MTVLPQRRHVLPARPDLAPRAAGSYLGVRISCSIIRSPPQIDSAARPKDGNATQWRSTQTPGAKMSLEQIGKAAKRVIAAFQRRPDMGMHADAPAVARWNGGTRVSVRHADGMEVLTDMPVELGGRGDQVTPGWLFRAGLASCAATSITLAAASEGIELTALEVHVGSRSDARGLLGMSEANGAPVYAGPFEVEMHVTIAANGASAAAIESMVTGCLKHSPVPSALATATPMTLHVNVAPA